MRRGGLLCMSAPDLSRIPDAITSVPAAVSGKAPERAVVRHSRVTRVANWVNAWVMTVMFLSGLQILNAHAALYWGQTGFDRARAWLEIGDDGADPPHGTLRIGTATIYTTGLLGVFKNADGYEYKAFPGWITIPSWRDLATGRRWHFLFAWILVINGLIYLITSIATRHLCSAICGRSALS